MRAIPEVEVFCSFYSTAICNAKKMQHCSSCIFLSIYSYVYCHFVEQAKKNVPTNRFDPILVLVSRF